MAAITTAAAAATALLFFIAIATCIASPSPSPYPSPYPSSPYPSPYPSSPYPSPYPSSPYPSPYPQSPYPYPSPSSCPVCNCGSSSSPADPHASGFLPVTRVSSSSAAAPSFVASVTFFPNNDHDRDEYPNYVPMPPQIVNLTLDSSCNQIILSRNDCNRLRLQDTCQDRSITCNATTAVCGSSDGEPVYPAQTPLRLFFNTSLPYQDLPSSHDDVPVLCSSGRMQGTAGLAPYRLSLVVQMHSKLGDFNLAKVFGYCLGKPQGYFFVGQPNYVFGSAATVSLNYIPTLRWDQDVLPVLKLTGMSLYDGDNFNVTAPLEESIFSDGFQIGTHQRYLTLVDPAYQWLRSTMMDMANASSLPSASSPFDGLDLCYTLGPNMSISDGGPQLELRFEDKSWVLEAMNFLVVTEDQHTVCLGAVSAGAHGVSSLGTLQQEEVVVEYNFDHQTVGVSAPLTRVGSGCGQLHYYHT